MHRFTADAVLEYGLRREWSYQGACTGGLLRHRDYGLRRVRFIDIR